MTKKRDTSNRRVLALPEQLAKALARYQITKGHSTQTSAVRELIRIGLAELQVPTKEKARPLPIEP